jgi:hypothetical protein
MVIVYGFLASRKCAKCRKIQRISHAYGRAIPAARMRWREACAASGGVGGHAARYALDRFVEALYEVEAARSVVVRLEGAV